MKKAKKSKSALFLYAAAILIFAVGTTSLVLTITTYTKTVAQYVAQGYPAALVTSELIPATLIPGILQAVGLYWGIAFVLFGLAVVSKKLQALLPAPVVESIQIEDIMEEETIEAETVEEDTEKSEDNE